MRQGDQAKWPETIMAAPEFAEVSQTVREEDDLHALFDNESGENTHTQRVIRSSLAILKIYLLQKGVMVSELETRSSEKINSVLRDFYAETRKNDGERYAKKSMLSLRYGLQKYFLNVRNEDIVKDKRYATCNKVFKAVLRKLKEDKVGETKRNDPILPEDISKLYDSVFSLENPQALQNKTLFEYIYHFCNSARRKLRELRKDDISVCKDSTGREYVTVREWRAKLHKDDDIHDTSSKRAKMYDRPGRWDKIVCLYLVIATPGDPVYTLEKWENQ